MAKQVKMGFEEFLREHKRLDKVLSTKSRKDDAEERKRQSSEVSKYRKKLRGKKLGYA
jgi:hypothetical protein